MRHRFYTLAVDTMAHYTLYGAQISYFTGKVRAYLDWKGLSYEELPATADVYRDVILPKVGFPVIPVVVNERDEVTQDSSHIIDELEARHGAPLITPPSALQRLASALLELYGDEWLVIPAMHYRWHHNRDYALREFGALNAPQATPQEQLSIGTNRAGPFAQAAVLLGASSPEMMRAIERSYEGLLADLDRHFHGHDYLLGSRPCLGDFGLYGPMYAHQYLDPASGALMHRLAPNLVRWVQRLESQPAPRQGEFVPEDKIPVTLEPVFQRQMREQLPVLADSIRVFTAWATKHPGEDAPRTLGRHTFQLEGATGERIVRPYSLWMLQRVQDVLKSMTQAERARAAQWLGRVGGEGLLTLPPMPRLVRRGLSVASLG